MGLPTIDLDKRIGMRSAALAIQPSAEKAFDAAERLIVALDFASAREATEMVDRLGSAVSFYKIGLHLLFAEDISWLEFLKGLRDRGKRIFLDFKWIDINSSIEGVIAGAARLRIEFATVYQSPLAIQAAKNARSSFPTPKILTVTLLTDRDQEYLKKHYNWQKSVSDFVVEKAIVVKDAGGDGVICSPNEVGAIRSVIGKEPFLIVTPGIRPEWSEEGGHKRAGTPTTAIINGADYLVVGRPIIRQKDARGAADKVIDEMRTAFEMREDC
jgi:orotidine-5'-phosphate decarboxylase